MCDRFIFVRNIMSQTNKLRLFSFFIDTLTAADIKRGIKPFKGLKNIIANSD